MAVAAAALMLSGCGGGGGGPGGGGVAGKMKEAIKPCDDANKATPKAQSDAKKGVLTLNEAKARADEGVAACEAAVAAYEGMTDMPPNASDACVGEAEAKLELAVALRAGLDHAMARPYKARIERASAEATAAVKACKDALAAKPEPAEKT